MPWTNLPNGLSLTTTTGTVSGQLNASNITVTTSTNTAIGLITAGTVSVSGAIIGGGNITGTTLTMSTATSNTFIGERAYLQFSFTSAASTAGLITVPFNGTLIDCWVSADVAARVCSAFTLYSANSASGSVAVASVALTFGTAIGQQVQATVTPVAVTTATAMAYVVTTAGTACNFYGVAVIQRTA